MGGDTLNYREIMRDAFLDVARRILAHAAEHGLQGETHFYITFRTDHPGVVMSARVKAQYPEEITIVLQNEFWDLAVASDRFSVGLSFDDAPETIVVPLQALTRFVDPTAKFGFEIPASESPDDAEAVFEEEPDPPSSPPDPAPAPSGEGQVVSLDAFRKR
ncbi:ClpXP protease specificity-enhancing factor SspB [Neomegalonema sp.]|uniref:ClpXP protease specificity-enhancing factor SspB n=1 Tax=Neomegalonema sp. TaxID=2039713 RepID=UPI002634D1D4|nr:ClpXP protease specificity-enhancing factor SspB [Neomegalonema sp.]MDD2867044.1 ClpXP protease specificity-enhancing factor SspB [Neomegalonema sp.]